MGGRDSSSCNFCNEEKYFLLHYLWVCPIAKEFWEALKLWLIQTFYMENFDLTPRETI